MHWVICSCMVCQRQNGIPCLQFERKRLTESNLYEFECSSGAVTISILQQRKFEILSELALINFAQNDFSGCCGKLYTAFERFLEFCQKLVLIENGIVDHQELSYWKDVKSNSERQLGAFLFARELSSKMGQQLWPSTPKLSALSEFRNKIVHQGHFANEEETEDFGQKILGFMFYTIRFMKDHKQDALQRTVSSYIQADYKRALKRLEVLNIKDSEKGIATRSVMLRVSLTGEVPEQFSMKALASEADQMDRFWADIPEGSAS